MNKSLKFFIMIGNIGSGKSTYINSKLKNSICVSKDNIRYGLGNGKYIFNPKTEPIVHATVITLTEGLCRNKVNNIVIDETNLTKRIRSCFIDIAKSYDYKVIGLLFPRLEKAIAVQRRLNNPHGTNNPGIWGEVWEDFDKKFEYPTLKEGFNKIIPIKLSAIL